MDSGIGYFSKNLGEDGETGLDVFSKYSEAELYTGSKYIPIKTVNAIQQAGPFLFEIGGHDSKDFVVLKSFRLTIKLRITNEDGSSLNDGAAVSVVNSFGHSLFENITTKINNVPISDHARLYPYKAYIQQCYSFSSAVKKSNLNCEYYFNDDVVTNNKVNVSCRGFKERGQMIKNSRVLTLSIIPYIDLASSPHYLCPGHSLSLEFDRSKQSFSLLSVGGEYKIHILDLTLWARLVEPVPSISANLTRKLSTSTVTYPFTRSVVRSFQVHSGTSHISINNILRGKLPRAVYFVFLENSQTMGAIDRNPFVFLNHDIMEASLNISGFPYPSEPVKYNFGEGDIMPGYRWFLDNIGIGDSDTDIGMTAEQYTTSYFLLPFDLSPRGDNGLQPHVTKEGVISLSVVLRTALSEPLTVLAYSVYENTVEVYI